MPHVNVQALAELLEHFSRMINAASFADGLTPAQWNLLRYLSRANEGARTVSAFARFHATTKSSASQTARVLVNKALIAIVPSNLDPRSKRLDLSIRGREFLAGDPLGSLGRTLETVSADRLESFAEMLTLLVNKGFQQAEIQPQMAAK
jgi:DNA-binding MarR family transcriptional regulator